MKKRNLVLGLIALLLVIAGTWGVLGIRARASTPASSRNGTAHASPTDQTSLYLTGALVIPTVKVSTSTATCDPKQIPGVDTRILFITNEVANDPNGLNADTGPSDPRLIVCYVEVYGNFRVDGGPPRLAGVTPTSQPVLHYGQLVFDGVTGNVLVMGVMA